MIASVERGLLSPVLSSEIETVELIEDRAQQTGRLGVSLLSFLKDIADWSVGGVHHLPAEAGVYEQEQIPEQQLHAVLERDQPAAEIALGLGSD